MRAFFIILVLVLLYGCKFKDSDPTGTVIVKEILQRSSYYISDSCYKGDEYAQYEFFDKSYRKTIFNESNLTTVKEILEDKIEYLNMLQISLYQEDKIFDCTVAENNLHSVSLICLNREFKDQSYQLVRTLWDSKDLALKNKDFDCSNVPK